MIRGLIFTGIYYVISAYFVLTALPLLLLPWRGPIRWHIKNYTRCVNLLLRYVCGIRKEVRGRENLPDGPYILAPKHASWGDGFLIYPEIEKLGFVTGDHLEKLPLVGGILGKLGAIVIRTCGGGDGKAKSLIAGIERIKGQNRRLLIYPEGHLAPVGFHFRYKAGVWHIQQALNIPIVPVATNLNCYWQQEEMRKSPGVAVLEFLPPIPPGLSKDDALQQLTQSVETRSAELIGEALKRPPRPSQVLPEPVKGHVPNPTGPAEAVALLRRLNQDGLARQS